MPPLAEDTLATEPVYLPDPDLVAAAQVALELGLPLLLTGEPGTGKTTFARYVADHLAPEYLHHGGIPGIPGPLPLHIFETKSTSVANDLFYRFDSLRRFHAVHDQRMSANTIDYITFEALGTAILESLPWHDVADLLLAEHHCGPRQAVVLIDEIDKAPRDFPNDLLNEIDHMRFRIAELTATDGRSVRELRAPKPLRPIVILTSNSEKNLPAPFLRRCVFHHIRFPEREFGAARLAEIVRANLAQASGPLTNSAIEFFYDIREQLELEKPPSTSELVQWVRILYSRNHLAVNHTRSDSELATLPSSYLKATLSVIGKTANDLGKIYQLADSQFGTSMGEA
ncbi:AAA family ATPase [Duganella sp. CY15W]|uniref:AAA family ATPase n=1 Tax=Duganella sp. CY15W TaxID=2692172 RepID=UPI0013692282|nr:MoxR family ATPase [Duganella sp. CY15W]MYM27965.1 AAA family ATPase [Duganella sp. CY15W]